MGYLKPVVLRYNDAITGADLDVFFDNLLAVANGSLEGTNFAPDAGLAIVNRQTQGNRFITSENVFTVAVAEGPAIDSPALIDIGAAVNHLGVPAVLKVLDIGMTIQSYSRVLDAGDDVRVQWRGFNTRTNAWTAWANTSISRPAVNTPTHDTTINPVISDTDYSKFQLRVEMFDAAGGGAGFTVEGLTVWAVLEGLHLP